MSGPTVLLTHYVLGGSGSTLRDEIAERLPDLDVVVAEDEADTHEHLPDAEVVLTQRFDPAFLDAPDLAWIQTLSAGVDAYPLDRLAERGVVVTNASGVHAEPIGEQILGYLLAFERNIHRGIHQQRDGEWSRYRAGELADRTVGIVGLGAIGSRAAELCSAVGAEVIGTKRDPSTAPAAADQVFDADGLDHLLDRAEYLVLACPLTEATRGLLGADEFAALGSSSVVVNVGRGELLDEAALVEALDAGDLRGAALDVFAEEPLPDESPLWDRRDVVVTPHMAGSTPHYWERCADIFADNYGRYLVGEDLRNRVA